MKIPPKRSILIGEDPAGKCNFQKSDGTFETSEVSQIKFLFPLYILKGQLSSGKKLQF